MMIIVLRNSMHTEQWNIFLKQILMRLQITVTFLFYNVWSFFITRMLRYGLGLIKYMGISLKLTLLMF